MELPMPDDWEGEKTCVWAVCWPDSEKWRAILAGLIEQPMQGRLWDFSTGDFLALRETFRPIYNVNFNLRRCILACDDGQFEQLLAALNNISASVSGGGCCGSGSRGSGSTAAEPIDYDQGETPTEPPPGFEDMTEYLDHKCRAAWAILNQLGSDLQSLAALTYGANSIPNLALIVITVLLTPVPYDDIIGLVALLLFTAISFTFLVLTSAIIFDNRFDIVCELYSATSVSDARSRLLGKISDLLDSETAWSAAEKEFVLDAIQFFVNNDNLNRLFEPTPLPDGEGDCSECEECEPLFDFDFQDSEDNGFALVASNCLGEVQLGSVSATPGSEGVNITCVSAAGLKVALYSLAGTWGPIEAGQFIRLTGRRNAGVEQIRLSIETDAGCRSLNLSSASFPLGAFADRDSVSLDDYIGETVERVTFYVNRSTSGSFDITLQRVALICT